MCAYSRRSYINFQCGICGRLARADQRVPQCMVCMVPLCDACNHSGFCRTHFALLSPEDQNLATEQYNKMVTSKRVMIGSVFGGLLIFIVAMVLGPMSYSYRHPSFTPVFILMPMLIFIPLVIGGAGYYQVTIKKTWRFLGKIGLKYKGPAEAPLGAPLWPRSPPQPVSFETPDSAQSVALPQAGFCSHCGAAWVPGARYCPYCGQSVV